MSDAFNALGSLGSDLVQSALRVGLARPINSFNRFTDKLASAAASPLASLNKALLSEANPYGKQNVFSVMNARPDPVLACDWIAVVVGSGREIGWEYIDTISTPSLDIQTHTHMVNNLQVKTGSVMDIGTVTIGLYTDIAATSMNWAATWYRQVHRIDGFYNLPAQYKKDIVLFLLDAKRRTVIDMRLIGCMPTTLSSYDLGADSALLVTSLTLSVDDVAFSSDTDLTAASQRIGSLFPSIPAVTGFGG